MITMADAIALCGVCAGLSGVIITGLFKIRPSTTSAPLNGNRPVTLDLCDAKHKPVVEELNRFRASVDKNFAELWRRMDDRKYEHESEHK